jgi:pimeloyl-ACP methyl ester carboxylesterase
MGFSTLLFDLLTEAEAADRSQVFDIPLLTDRLVGVIEWIRSHSADHPAIGIFGASTGAAAALAAAARLPDEVAAVVSRGGRPDLAMGSLHLVKAPTLLIVGGNDTTVLGLNRQALAVLHYPARLTVIPGAGHLFEEPGTLDQVASLAGTWFGTYLGVDPHREA